MWTKEKQKAYAKKWSQENKHKRREYDHKARVRNPAKIMLKSAFNRAKKANVPFDIIESDIIIPNFCPVLGIPLKVNRGAAQYDSPSLDRIKPNLGYVKGNIIVVSFKANMIKNSATYEEIFSVAEFYKNLETK